MKPIDSSVIPRVRHELTRARDHALRAQVGRSRQAPPSYVADAEQEYRASLGRVFVDVGAELGLPAAELRSLLERVNDYESAHRDGRIRVG